jgi:hypothetical protein
MLNSQFYRQHLIKENKCQGQTLELGLLTNIFHKFWCIFDLHVTSTKYMVKYAIEENAKQIFNKIPKQPMNLGQALAWGYLGLASNPLEQGGGEWAGLGVAAPMVRPHRPQLSLAPPSSGGAFNAWGGWLHGCLPKIPHQTIILKLYKKTPSSHS